MTLFITILQLLCGLIVIGIVLFQSGKSAGLSGAIGGVADSFMAKNKAKSTDARLARATKWVGAAFLLHTDAPAGKITCPRAIFAGSFLNSKKPFCMVSRSTTQKGFLSLFSAQAAMGLAYTSSIIAVSAASPRRIPVRTMRV